MPVHCYLYEYKIRKGELFFMYAQLDFTNNPYKRVNLIGGEEVGIIPSLIQQYPNDFVNLDGRIDIEGLDTQYYYDVLNDKFITWEQVPAPTPEVVVPVPSNTDIAQMISDLQADMMISSKGGI